MKNILRKIRLLLLLVISLKGELFAQTFMDYGGELLNEMDVKNEAKVGVWKLFNPYNGVIVEGKVVNNKRLEDITYTVNGVVFAKQLNDSVFDILENGALVRMKLRKEVPSDTDTTDSTIQPDEWSVRKKHLSFIREDGTFLDEKQTRTLLDLCEIRPIFYGDFISFFKHHLKYWPDGKRSVRIAVYFVIDINGEIMGSRIEKSENRAFNREVLRVVRKMPRWQPGFFLGEFGRIGITFPVIMGPQL